MHKDTESKNTDEPLTEVNPPEKSTDIMEEEVKNEINDAKSTIAEFMDKINKLEIENQELKDNYLRKQADFENFRKRMAKDKEDGIRYANQILLLDITDTIDNFERAIKSADASKDFDAFYNGIVLIEKKMVSTLESKWGVKRFSSEGEVFDPEKHQAIAVEDSKEHDKQVVLEDFQKGYLYNERVLRPAKVKVCNPLAGIESTNNNA